MHSRTHHDVKNKSGNGIESHKRGGGVHLDTLSFNTGLLSSPALLPRWRCSLEWPFRWICVLSLLGQLAVLSMDQMQPLGSAASQSRAPSAMLVNCSQSSPLPQARHYGLLQNCGLLLWHCKLALDFCHYPLPKPLNQPLPNSLPPSLHSHPFPRTSTPLKSRLCTSTQRHSHGLSAIQISCQESSS